MKIDVIPGRNLAAPLAEAWREIQHSNPALCSPYFAPEFTSAIAAARDDVEIAIFRERDDIVAFFPFQRESKTIAKAAGHPLSDYHGVVCRPTLDFDPLEVLRACKLVSWDFDHVLVQQTPFLPFHQAREVSPIIDLSRGFDSYVAAKKASGSGFRIPFQLMRKLEREVGPLTFHSHVNDINLLHFIMERKSEQYKRSGVPDLFAEQWIRRAVENVFHTQTPHFSGMLSVLNAGSQIVAALMSIRSSDVWHAWFFGFDESFSQYSPGIISYLKVAECGGALGFRYLDFGKGDQPYKKRLMNGSIPLALGSVELPSWVSFRRHMSRKIKAGIKATPLAKPLRQLVNRLQEK